MKSSMVLACALALPGIALASDHGPVFSYATPVNSQGEVSCDAGLFGRSGSKRLATLYRHRMWLRHHAAHHCKRLPSCNVRQRLASRKSVSIQVANGLPERHGASSTRSRV